MDLGACPRVVAEGLRLTTSGCPSEAGGITGLVLGPVAPVAGARVHLGADSVATGSSGRFFLDLVPSGLHPVTVTAPCALTLAAGPVLVRPRAVTNLGGGSLARGDVVANCAVDLADLVAVASQYKALPPFYPACTDLDGDGTVSLYDLVTVAGNYDRACPTSWDGRSPEPPGARGAQAVAMGPAAEPSQGPAPRILAPEGAPAPLVTRPGDLVLRLAAGAPAAGWSLAWPFDPARTAVVDQDMGTAGVQPFRLPRLSRPAWVVENRIDPVGELRLTVALLGAGGTLAPGAELGLVRVSGRPLAPAALSARLAGPEGRPLPGEVVPVPAGVAPGLPPPPAAAGLEGPGRPR
jgi:hypothetical protein